MSIWAHRDQDEFEFKKARLLFNHPAGPSGVPMVESFRNRKDPATWGDFLQKFFRAKPDLIRFMILHAFTQAAQLLVAEDRRSDACWLLDYGRQHRPDIIGESARQTSGVYQDDDDNLGVYPPSALEDGRSGKFPEVHRGSWRAHKSLRQ